MRPAVFLLSLVLTACGTEADRTCSVIREQGVSIASTRYAACVYRTAPDGGEIAPDCPVGYECYQTMGRMRPGLCTQGCGSDSDCAGATGSGRSRCFVSVRRCAIACTNDADCVSGTVCAALGPGGVDGRACVPVSCP